MRIYSNNKPKMLVLFVMLLYIVLVDAQGDPTCLGLSADVNCQQCRTETGRCMPGNVPVDDWLKSTAKTQRELQIDEPWDRLQMLDAHNGYNARASGYGLDDTCDWPPPYPQNCNNYANQEFSFTDLLNMGIRALEIDNWYCADEMRMAHLGSDIDLDCTSGDRLFSDGIQEIGVWLNQSGNRDDMVKIYINEKEDQGRDQLVNDPLRMFLGDRILTPNELEVMYNGEWPTMREMRKMGKNVVVASGSTAGSGDVYTHGDVYIHKIYWQDLEVSSFTDYPACGNKNLTNKFRFYSDSTHYGDSLELKHDGPSSTGVIYDFTEYVKCRIQYPGTDMITPDLIKTAMFTWAEGEPSAPLTERSCVWINQANWRWYLADNCNNELRYACQNTNDPDDWAISGLTAPYDATRSDICPAGYTFAVPTDGYRNQKLREASIESSVWINYSPWLQDDVTDSSHVHVISLTCWLVGLVANYFV